MHMPPAQRQKIVAELDAIDGSDPEVAHSLADDVLIKAMPPSVQAASQRLRERCGWWASA